MRQILPILLITLFTAFSANGQDSRNPGPDVMGKVVKLYPNPATTYITFDLQKNYQKGLTIVVYNFLGKKMYETQNVPEKTTITLTDYTRGVYIYHLTDLSGKVMESGKFQVSR
ncbi:MAG TPA: T9SS type A sorting domain-containing protein [Chitinophagaceae bacterium]